MVFSLTPLEVLAVQSCSSRLNDFVFARILSTPCQRSARFLRSLGGADISVEVQTPVTLAIVCTVLRYLPGGLLSGSVSFSKSNAENRRMYRRGCTDLVNGIELLSCRVLTMDIVCS